MSFTVCIDAQDDGQYRVYVELPNEAAEAPEGQPAMPMEQPPANPEMAASPESAEPGAQTVGTVKEALTIVLQALKNNGKLGEDKDQLAGFNSIAGA